MTAERPRTARTPTWVPHEVSFRDGAVSLAGTLAMPRRRPHAGVVMIHGSGAADRYNGGYFAPIRSHLARHGLAVLCYDKPGIGGSSGDWRGQTLHGRAEEALAALRFLQGRGDIDPSRVGLYGHSQGGWVVPLAASTSRDVAFIIAVSGPGVSPAEQGRYAVEEGMRCDQWPEDHVAEAVAFIDHLSGAARRGEDFGSIEPALCRARTAAWFEHLPKYFPILDEELWSFLTRRDPLTGRPFVDYDPVPVLERVARCPVLAIFGERDWVVPVRASVAAYEAALTRAGNRDFTITVFPDANHRIYSDHRGEFAPAFLETLTHWILQRTVTVRPRLGAPEAPSTP